MHVDSDGSGYIGIYIDKNGKKQHGISWNEDGLIDDFHCQGSYADISEIKG
jgi:hypothetical protein